LIKWIIIFILMLFVLGVTLNAFACDVVSIVKPDGTIVNCTICGTIVNCL